MDNTHALRSCSLRPNCQFILKQEHDCFFEIFKCGLFGDIILEMRHGCSFVCDRMFCEIESSWIIYWVVNRFQSYVRKDTILQNQTAFWFLVFSYFSLFWVADRSIYAPVPITAHPISHIAWLNLAETQAAFRFLLFLNSSILTVNFCKLTMESRFHLAPLIISIHFANALVSVPAILVK